MKGLKVMMIATIFLIVLVTLNCSSKKIAFVKVANIGKVAVICQVEGFQEERIESNAEKIYEFEFESDEYLVVFTIWPEGDMSRQEVYEIDLSAKDDYYLTVGWEQ
jgi:hypothetical protein